MHYCLLRCNVPVICLGSWDLEADLMDDDILSGTVPVLFADDVQAAETALQNDPALLRRGVENLQRMFFTPEHLDKEEAYKVIRKPRMGDADFTWKQSNLDRLFMVPSSSVGRAGKNLFLTLTD